MKRITSILKGWCFTPLLILLAISAVQAQNCEIDGVTEFEWYFGREIPILDTAQGVTFEATTTDIQSVTVSSSSTENALNGGPYVAVTYADNQVVVTLLDAFADYEEIETSLSIQTDLVFTCTVATRILNIRHLITDTNNHAPQFLPGNQYEFTIFTPTGAGTPLTRLYTEIIVRDIDLTTSSIDFGIEANDKLSISYLQRDASDPKNFHALLETSSIIMGLDGAVDLQITATDVDGTAGPQITTNGAVILAADAQSLQLPTTPVFGQSIYTGSYSLTDGLVIEGEISLIEGYDDSVTFSISGDENEYFSFTNTSNIITVTVSDGIPNEVLYGNTHILLSLRALKENTVGAWATIAITFPIEPTLRFQEHLYKGSIEDNELQLSDIFVSEGYRDGINFTITGEYENFFSVSNENNIISITLTTPLTDDILEAVHSIALVLGASGENLVEAASAIVLDIINEDVVHPRFSEPYYTGSYNSTAGLSLDSSIVLSQGYDETVNFSLAGDHAQHFSISNENEVVLLSMNAVTEAELEGQRFLLVSVLATKPGAEDATTAVHINLPDAISPGVVFSSAVYEGIYEEGSLSFEPVVVESGYTDDVTFNLTGELATYFNYIDNNGIISITLAFDSLPENIVLENTFIPIVLEAIKPLASNTRTVLIVAIHEQDLSETPTVTFQTYSLVISATSSQLGVIGTVSATASNGETIIYTLSIESEHLNERLQIGGATGELSLSSYVDIGNYNAIVTATTFVTRVAVNTTVQINIENVTACISEDYILDPLIIISRDEEEAHQDLVVLTSDMSGICNYHITNQYPAVGNWFYIDSSGSLSCNAIDREHSSIAFMPQSQIQIELTLTCIGNEEITVNDTYSTFTQQMYSDTARNEYNDIDGRFWILTASIQFNNRRSLVNVIINDINDNDPIFEGKENEPVVIGYPNADIVGMISPPSFATVHATDADIGHNAHVRYSTENSLFAIHPDSGVVYIRDNALTSLSNGDTVRVVATDQYGDGRSAYLDMEVRLLQSEHIVLVTVKGAYLEDVNTIVANLTSILQHKVKTLSSFVVPENEDVETRGLNNPTKGFVLPSGHIDPRFLARDYILRDGETNEATLSIYVYALDAEKVPLSATDIVLLVSASSSSMAWSVVSASFQQTVPVVVVEVVSSQKTSLLVSTILLSVLLVMLVLACVVWYFIIRKNNYKSFSDTSSGSSHRTSLQADSSNQPSSKDMLTTLSPVTSPLTILPPNHVNPASLSPIPPPPAPLTPDHLSPTTLPPTTLPHTPLSSSSISYYTPYTITFDDTSKKRSRIYEKHLDPSNDKIIDEQQKTPSNINNPPVDISILKSSENDLPSPLSYADETFVAFPTEKLEEVDEDEFGESKVKRRKSVVTFNEHVEKIHVEKIPADPEVEDELEQEYHRL